MTMQADFLPFHSPQNDIREEECARLGKELAQIFLNNFGAERDFREFARSVPYGDYPRLFSATIRSCARRRDEPGRRFYHQLESEYSLYDADPGYSPQAWNKALGAIIEYAFLELMKIKYKGDPARILHEHKFRLTLPDGGEISSETRPMDVIAWFDADLCGEFLEIKKDLDTKDGDDRFSEKVDVMYRMLKGLDAHCHKASLVGVGTLARSPFGAEVVRAALIEHGHLQSDQSVGDVEPSLTIVHSDNVRQWQSRKVG